MGTSWLVQIASPTLPDLAGLQANIESRLLEINAQMSTWDPDSLICKINAAPKGWYALPKDFYQVTDTALKLASLTEGAFDPTLGELINLWGFGPAGPVSAPPNAHVLRTALLRSGWRKTALNQKHHAIWQPGGLRFDFSSIAKGYAVDEIASLIDTAGLNHYLVELGGEMKARDHANAQRPWRVDIAHPNANLLRDHEGLQWHEAGSIAMHQKRYVALPIVLKDAALATSGDYLRSFTYHGVQYSHTLDGRTGQPIANKLAAVSIIHESAMWADAMATAIQCLGPDKGWEFAQNHELAAIFFIRQANDYEVKLTPQFKCLAGAE